MRFIAEEVYLIVRQFRSVLVVSGGAPAIMSHIGAHFSFSSPWHRLTSITLLPYQRSRFPTHISPSAWFPCERQPSPLPSPLRHVIPLCLHAHPFQWPKQQRQLTQQPSTLTRAIAATRTSKPPFTVPPQPFVTLPRSLSACGVWHDPHTHHSPPAVVGTYACTRRWLCGCEHAYITSGLTAH